MTNNPKLTPEQRRKKLYFQKWGLNEKNSTGDLRQDMRNWRYEADAEKKKVTTPPIKIDVDSITESRLRYERLMGGEDD